MRPGLLRPSSGAVELRRALRVCAASATLALIAGCFTGDDGVSPPQDGFYYPTGLAVSPGATTLYVANSDFDLQFNGGTVQALDLVGIRGDLIALRDNIERSRPITQAGTGGAGDTSGGAGGSAGGAGGSAGGSDAGGSGGIDAGGGGTDPGAGGKTTVCQDLGLPINPNPVLAPGPCGALPLPCGRGFGVPSCADDREDGSIGNERGYIWASVSIGAFASGVALVAEPAAADSTVTSERARLFVPVRGDPSVTFFEINHDEGGSNPCSGAAFCLQCGATGTDQRCGPTNRIGESAGLNKRGLVLPVEPVGIAASSDGRALVVAHQTTGQASLIVNDFGGVPTLEFPLSNLPPGPTEVAAIPIPGYVSARNATDEPRVDYGASFLLTFRGSPEIDVLRFNPDEGSSPPRPFLTRAFAEGIQVDSNGSDSRGIAVDASARQACEADCSAGDPPLTCLRDCMDVPLRVFIANRAPSTLLIGEVKTEVIETDAGELTGIFETLNIYDAVPLAFGASKVTLGHVIDEEGGRRLRAFAVAFDSRKVFIYDPDARRVEATIQTGRGPHAVAVDNGPPVPVGTPAGPGDVAFLYVGHFTDSYIGVVDLDMRHRRSFGQMFAAIGRPTPPAEAN